MPNSAASGQGPKPGNSENNNGALLPGNLGLGSEPGNGVSLSGNCDNAGVVGQAMGPTPSSSSVEEFGDANSGSNPVATSASGDVISQLSSHLSVASIASSTESSAESAEAKTRSNNMIGGGGALAAAAASPLNHPPSLLDSDNPMSLPAQNPSQQQPRPHPPSTGAIPKSISFDKNVLDHNSDLGLADAQDGAKGGGGNGKSNSRGDKGFFKSWKLPKIGRSRGGAGGGGNMSALNRNIPGLPNPGLSRSNDYEYGERLTSDDSFNIPEHAEGPAALLRRAVSDETSDDILAKYRKKSASHTTDSIPDSNGSGPDIIDSGGEPFNEEQDERLIIDPMNVESSFAFQDAKRKLRLMLAEADLSSLSNLHQTRKKDSSSAAAAAHHRQGETPDNEIVVFLRVQLAEAHNLQDRSLVAQLHETLRCINLFDSEQCRKLLRSLREDYKRRSPYLSYLVRCRQGLLTTLSHQQRLLSRMEVDQRVCSQYLVSVCVRIFLERKEKQMQQFVYKFKELSVSDEKIALMESFLQKLWRQLEEDPSWALAASEEQMNLGRLTIERAVISQIYMFALYPNGEADVHRDEVLREHILRLSGVITCSHRDLKIPRQYHYEQPWPSAQEEIKRLAAFKTPSDKVACVARCSQTIMNLLSLASSKSVPAADDFVPVMVFVLIKANPQGLLSTVQYVESFYGNRMSGEDQYWWMQFVGAIEFIKTMDYHL